MHLDLVTVTDLLHELEAYTPDAEVRRAQQPAWPFEDAIDPGNAGVQVDLDGTSVVDLGQGAQLGYSPSPPATSSAHSHPEQQGAHYGMHPW